MRSLRFFAGSVVLLLTATFALAQTGSIQGTVADSAGAVVQGAEVTVKNLGSNAVRTATSGGTGAYSIPSLAPGAYEITVKMASLKTFHVSDIQLTVGQALSVNPVLEPGAVTEEVEVRADQIPDVDLETSQVSNLVDARSIKDLPLITRNPYELVLLSPGTSQTNSFGGITVNGSRERNNNFLLDGVDNNDAAVPGGFVSALSADPEATQEFRVITNNFAAEYGRNTGAIIDVVTKSGTNQFHGDAYEYGRWNGFGGARDWFNRKGDGPQDPYIRHQFGFSIGGPIRKDKTFFFFNDEIDRFITSLTNVATVPTAAFKTGVFTYTSIDPNTLGSTTVPVDITETGANNYSTLGYPVPPAPADPTMQKIFALYPTPTFDDGNGFSGTLLYPSPSRTHSYQTVAKIDHHFTDRETLSLRYGYDHFEDPDSAHDDILPGGLGSGAQKSISQGLSANLVSSLTTNVLNSFTFSFNRIFAGFKCNGLSTLDSVAPVDRFGNGTDYFMDPFTNFGCISLAADSQARHTGTDSYIDIISWVHGAHTWKFGGDFRNVHEFSNTNFTSRRQADTTTFFNTGGQVSLLTGVANTSTALEDAVSAYYGFVWKDLQGEFFNKAGVRQPTDDKRFRQHEYDWYGQDTWKVRRNFTLTYGLRYQLDGVPYEENANFSNLLGNPAGPAPLVMSIVGPGTGHQLYNTDYSNLEPRVGFSWDPWSNGKTAVRAAFGIFHDRVFGNLFDLARGNPPFEQDYVVNPFETLNNFFGGFFNNQPYVLPSVPDTTPSAIIPDGSQLGPWLFDTHFRNPVSNNWSFGIQREMPGGNTVDAAYVGSKGTHVSRRVDGNPPDPKLVNELVAFCSDPTNSFGCTPATVTFSNLLTGADGNFPSLPFNAVAQNAVVQPFLQRSVGNSIYHSLQVKLTHHLSHGLQLQGAYTWAHGIDDSSDPLRPAIGNRTFPRNSRNPAEERGNSDNDVRHIGVISYIWETPIGKGKSYLNSGFVGKVFEGIQFSGITSLQTGHPFDVFSTTDMERTGLSGRADLVGDPFAPGSNTQASAGGSKVWFTNPAAFSGRLDADGGPAFVGPGSSGRNHFYGPSFVNFDVTFAKKMKVTERFGAELRVECYNIFNHPHFDNPGSDPNVNGNSLGSPIFGLITNTVTRPDGTTSARQLQVALKVSF